MDMRLHEALKASKSREALAENHGATVLASDAGLTIVNKQRYEQKSWADLLPCERDLMKQLDWEPLNPRPPLQQLADSLTDWTD